VTTTDPEDEAEPEDGPEEDTEGVEAASVVDVVPVDGS
jgi:hypothetical protein